MARRSRTSLLADFTSALSRLPWWLCLLFGVIALLILHRIASQPFAISVRPNEIASAMFGSIFRAAAMVGQYLIPILCVAAAIMSHHARSKRRRLVLHTTDGGSFAAAIDAMSWQDFELLIGEAFRLQGFTVSEKGGAGADGGVDLELLKNGERYLVQAKHWRAKQVPVEVVRELAGVMPFRRAVGAYVVTSGRFTQPAADFAAGRGIKLVNGGMLRDLLVRARASLDAKSNGNGRRESGPAASPTAGRPSVRVESQVPLCPSCSMQMKFRTAAKGPNAGRSFWGCSTYPKCKGTRTA